MRLECLSLSLFDKNVLTILVSSHGQTKCLHGLSHHPHERLIVIQLSGYKANLKDAVTRPSCSSL